MHFYGLKSTLEVICNSNSEKLYKKADLTQQWDDFPPTLYSMVGTRAF